MVRCQVSGTDGVDLKQFLSMHLASDASGFGLEGRFQPIGLQKLAKTEWLPTRYGPNIRQLRKNS